jgi:hypothetical protein
MQRFLKVRNATACASSKAIASSVACAPRSTTPMPIEGVRQLVDYMREFERSRA